MALSLYNLSSIVIFALANNDRGGSLPTDLFLTLPHLQWFQIYGNQFSGSIPVSLSNASELKVFSAELNNFTGKVSVNFGGLQRFLKLNIYGNNLGSGDADEMDFFQSLVNCSSFQYMGLTENQFEGTLPKVLAIFQHSRNFSCSSKKKKNLNFSQLAKILFLEKFPQNLYSGQHDQLIYG